MRILITGCSSGVGRAAALRLAAAGHQVHATLRRQEDARALADGATGDLRPLILDVTDAAAARAALAAIEAEAPLDAVVNNAGIPCFGAIEELPAESLRQAMEVNFFGAFTLCQAATPFFRARRRGLIVNVSSSLGRAALPLYGGYCASKWALEAMTEALHHELEPFGVAVRLLQPGLIATPFAEAKRGQAARLAEHTAYGAQLNGPSPPDLQSLVSTPEAVAASLQSLIEAPAGPFRRTVGEDSRRWIEARRGLDDAGFFRKLAARGYGFDPDGP